MDPFAKAVHQEIKGANGMLRIAIDGLSGEALNWRPAGPDTNSLYVLATHMIGAQRFWVAAAVGKTVKRDRDAEFAAKGESIAPLQVRLGRAEAEVEEWLEVLVTESLAQPLHMRGRRQTVAGCLANIVRHLGEHAGQASLTRQLWEQQRAQPKDK